MFKCVVNVSPNRRIPNNEQQSNEQFMDVVCPVVCYYGWHETHSRTAPIVIHWLQMLERFTIALHRWVCSFDTVRLTPRYCRPYIMVWLAFVYRAFHTRSVSGRIEMLRPINCFTWNFISLVDCEHEWTQNLFEFFFFKKKVIFGCEQFFDIISFGSPFQIINIHTIQKKKESVEFYNFLCFDFALLFSNFRFEFFFSFFFL